MTFLLGLSSCTSRGKCEPGSEGCPCADGETCKEGLACASKVCVDLKTAKSSAGRLPTAEEVCDKMVELARKESASGSTMAQQLEKNKGDCITSVDKQRAKKGDEEYAREARCVLDANTFEDVMKCDS